MFSGKITRARSRSAAAAAAALGFLLQRKRLANDRTGCRICRAARCSPTETRLAEGHGHGTKLIKSYQMQSQRFVIITSTFKYKIKVL